MFSDFHTHPHTITLLKTLGRNERTYSASKAGISLKEFTKHPGVAFLPKGPKPRGRRERPGLGAGHPVGSMVTGWAPKLLPVVKECHLLLTSSSSLSPMCGGVAAPLTLAEHWNSHTSLSSRPELCLSLGVGAGFRFPPGSGQQSLGSYPRWQKDNSLWPSFPGFLQVLPTSP